MKSRGTLRKIDNLGRITLPKEFRRALDLVDGDPVEICLEEDHISLCKFERSCAFCGSGVQLMKHRDKYVCQECVDALKKY